MNEDKIKEIDSEVITDTKVKPVYFLSFIIMLILISIAYASLAFNLGIKVINIEEPKPVEPEKPTKPEKPSRVLPAVYVPVETGVTEIKDLNWHIEFDNVKEKDGSVTPIKKAKIADNKTDIYYEVKLDEPGDFYEFTADIVNSGSHDAKIYEIINNGLTTAQKRYLDYKITYKDGTKIDINDTLNANSKKTVKFVIKFRTDIEASDLPDEAQTLSLSYKIVYVEK